MQHRTDPELDFLLRNRPNIYGNSLLIFLIKLVAWLLAIAFFVLGIIFTSNAGLLDGTEANENLQHHAHSNLIYAVSSFLLGLSMLVIVWFGRMLIRRNQFIMALDEWYEKQLPEKNGNKKV